MKAFAQLVARQANGDLAVQTEISSLPVSLEDGYCLWNLYQEWNGAFSFLPGRQQAIDPICRTG